jgi:hypothetical protein
MWFWRMLLRMYCVSRNRVLEDVNDCVVSRNKVLEDVSDNAAHFWK